MEQQRSISKKINNALFFSFFVPIMGVISSILFYFTSEFNSMLDSLEILLLIIMTYSSLVLWRILREVKVNLSSSTMGGEEQLNQRKETEQLLHEKPVQKIQEEDKRINYTEFADEMEQLGIKLSDDINKIMAKITFNKDLLRETEYFRKTTGIMFAGFFLKIPHDIKKND